MYCKSITEIPADLPKNIDNKPKNYRTLYYLKASYFRALSRSFFLYMKIIYEENFDFVLTQMILCDTKITVKWIRDSDKVFIKIEVASVLSLILYLPYFTLIF